MESLKSLAKNVLNQEQRSTLWEWRQQYRRSLKEYHRQWQSWWQSLKYRGNNYTCPCCGGNFREFLPYGSVIVRNNAQCPRCGSLERHRLLWLFCQEKTNLFTASLQVLHIAPEKWFQNRIN